MNVGHAKRRINEAREYLETEGYDQTIGNIVDILYLRGYVLITKKLSDEIRPYIHGRNRFIKTYEIV